MSRKWIYGKQDWKTFERGQENCYLMTNGLGGFSSLTATGSAARNDHAFFMAALRAPNSRYNMIHRLRESLGTEEGEILLSSQEFADGTREEGFQYLAEFSYEDTPVWKFLTDGVEVEKEAAMKQQENTAAVIYRVRNRSRKKVRLNVTPFFQFVPKGEDLEPGRRFIPVFHGNSGKIESGEFALYFRTDGETEEIPEQTETYYYAYDACDGRREKGTAKACLTFSLEVPAGQMRRLAIVFGTEEHLPDEDHETPESSRTEDSRTESGRTDAMAEDIIRGLKSYRAGLADQAGFRDENARFLSKSADQFISRRESTGGKTILAGYPFFEDWGRDTMIALPGVCISTRRYEDAKSILRTFARYERKGLMPNLFPEGKNEPMYNTVDAALLFINCVWLCYEAEGDAEFVREMYPVMERIIRAYRDGTDYGIHMDEDGLIAAGQGLDQVTWMDVRVGEILPTPRHGKPVEVNAYWYNALKIMGNLNTVLGKEDGGYEEMAEKVKASFTEKFWREDAHCLRDVLSDTEADCQIRCNQIWAVSMHFAMLDEEKERQVVDTVFEKLYTPYGLRTLEKADPQFHPFYGGEMLQRDLAYHQGTVWTFPLGAYYLAYLKVYGDGPEARKYVRDQLEMMDGALKEGCIGQLPEIYDGENPVSSKGCFAQAWSVGELLRVYERLEW